MELFTKAVAAGQNITFTGSLSNGPTTVSGKPFPQKNEGHSGSTIDQDASLIPSPALSTASGGIPHIILLHIGTNDIYAASGQSTMPDRLGTLMDKIIAAAPPPDALLVVGKITPLSNASWNATVKTYNDAIPRAGAVPSFQGQPRHAGRHEHGFYLVDAQLGRRSPQSDRLRFYGRQVVFSDWESLAEVDADIATTVAAPVVR